MDIKLLLRRQAVSLLPLSRLVCQQLACQVGSDPLFILSSADEAEDSSLQRFPEAKKIPTPGSLPNLRLELKLPCFLAVSRYRSSHPRRILQVSSSLPVWLSLSLRTKRWSKVFVTRRGPHLYNLSLSFFPHCTLTETMADTSTDSVSVVDYNRFSSSLDSSTFFATFFNPDPSSASSYRYS